VKVDPGTDTIAVRTEFPNPDGVLVPGQFAEIVIEEAAPEESLVIPQSALQIDQAGAFPSVPMMMRQRLPGSLALRA